MPKKQDKEKEKECSIKKEESKEKLKAAETAIDQICSHLQCDSKEIVFTSGATESINMAIKGVFDIYKRKGNHIITCKTEHKAVLDVCASIEKKGGRVSYLNVDRDENRNRPSYSHRPCHICLDSRCR